jgi:hypothetical protein
VALEADFGTLVEYTWREKGLPSLPDLLQTTSQSRSRTDFCLSYSCFLPHG